MSEARERLIEAGEDGISRRWVAEVLRSDSDPQYDAEAALHAFLQYPDDLLAVLVEEGVLERFAYTDTVSMLYRLTEGNTR